MGILIISNCQEDLDLSDNVYMCSLCDKGIIIYLLGRKSLFITPML